MVPSPFHRMDAKIWKARYPGLRVLTPAGAAARVEEVVPVDRGTLADPEVSLITVPGTGEREAALEVRRGRNLTVVVNDIIGNVPFPPDWVARLLIRMLGFGGGRPQVPRMVKLALIKDKPALKRQLLAWAAEFRLEDGAALARGAARTGSPRGACGAGARARLRGGSENRFSETVLCLKSLLFSRSGRKTVAALLGMASPRQPLVRHRGAG